MLASCLHAREEPPRATIPSGAHGRATRPIAALAFARPRYHQATATCHVVLSKSMLAKRQRSNACLILEAGVRTKPTSGLPRAGPGVMRQVAIGFMILATMAATAVADLLLLASPIAIGSQLSPPPSPAPPLSSLSQLGRLTAQLSSTYTSSYGSSSNPAANAIDGSLSTYCLSTLSDSPWLSVRVNLQAAGARVGYVVIHARDHAVTSATSMNLLPFDVYVGSAAGDPSSLSSSHRCGGVSGADSDGPFTVWCGDVSTNAMSFVTLSLPGSGRYLVLTEVEAYVAPPALPPAPPAAPPPAPPLGSLMSLPRLSATLSSSSDASQPASNAIDNNPSTTCRSNLGSNQWLSVQVFNINVLAGVGHVAIYNAAADPSLLSPFEVWVGVSAGDMGSSATKCAGPMIVPNGPGPFTLSCNGAISTVGPPFVTLYLPGANRVVNIGELYAYATVTTPAGPSPPLTPPPISPPPPSPAPPPPSPPPVPAPPLASLTRLTRLGATLSSSSDASQPASNAIDDDTSTTCRSNQGSNQWLSVQVITVEVAAGIGFVAIYNGGADLSLLSPFEVWVGASAGDMGSTAIKCAGPMNVPSGPGPFTLSCNGATSPIGPPFVTLYLPGANRVVSIGELYAYARITTPAAPSPPLVPPPTSPTERSSQAAHPPPSPPPPSPSPPPPSPSPPPIPAPPLGSHTRLPSISATLSSSSDASQPASHAIDGQLSTTCRSDRGSNQWLTVQVLSLDPTAGIGNVFIFNNPADPSLLWPFELWVGASAADRSATATKCADIPNPSSTSNLQGPFVLSCGGASSPIGPPFVTLYLPGANRAVSISEMYVYATITTPGAPSPSPPPPLLPPPSPSPPPPSPSPPPPFTAPSPPSPPSPQPPPPSPPPPSPSPPPPSFSPPPPSPPSPFPPPRPSPPPVPAPPIGSLSALSRISATLSSSSDSSRAAGYAIDNNPSTTCRSDQGSNQWLSVQVPNAAAGGA